jgi:hypothetical protein
MKKYWLIFLTVSLILTVLVMNTWASETRAFSMGQTGVFMDDNSNIVLFPGNVMRFGNEIVTELRLKDNEGSFSAEVRLPFNSYMFGLNFNRPISVYNPGVGSNIRLDQTSDLYFGTKLGDNDLGLRLSYGRDGYNQDSTFFQPQLEENARYLEIAAGLSSDVFDLGLSFELPSISSEQSGNKDEFSGNNIMINGRYFYQYDSKIQFVPVVRASFGSAGRETDLGAGIPKAKTDYSATNINLGIGLNYQFTEKSLIIVAIDPFGYSKLKEDETGGDESTITTTTLPRLYLGAETTIRPWIIGRIGANRAYQVVKTTVKPDQGDEVESSYQTSPYNVSFGLGLKFGNFLIDLDINDGFFFEGPNFMSGRFRDFSNRVSVSYLFSN